MAANPTPFHEATSKSGARFQEVHGWLLPQDFGNSSSEYSRTRDGAAVFDISHHGKVQLSGADAARFLHNLCTNDLLKLAVGHGCEAFLTTNQAKIAAYVLIYRDQASDGAVVLELDSGPGMGQRVAHHFDRFLISEQVDIADQTADLAQLHLAGPKAGEVLEKVITTAAPAEQLQHIKTTLTGQVVDVRRHSPLGLPGFDIVVPASHSVPLWDALVQAGATPAGMDLYQILRVEAGTPEFGRDIDETNLPQEIGRVDQTVSFTKGCYIGQETVARIRAYGHVNRLLVRLQLEGQGTEPRGARLFRDGKEVGMLTSCVESPVEGRVIALGYVRRGNQEPGTRLQVAEAKRIAEVRPLD